MSSRGEWKLRAASETDDTKRCSQCDVLKPLLDFNKHSQGRKGRMSWCKECWSQYAKARNATEEYRGKRREYKKTPEGKRANRMSLVKITYGPDAVAVENRRNAPDAKCDVCGSANRLGIDHSHDTHKVRGLLCHNCNVALGLLNDDPTRLRLLARYLEERQ